MLLQAVTTSLVNLVVFGCIPFLWWFFRHRRQVGFAAWLGLKRPRLCVGWPVLLAFAAAYLFFYNFDFTVFIDPATLAYLESSGSVSANAYAGLGLAAVPPVLVETFIANGLAEEILYRGFLTKRLCAKLGRGKGIAAQAVLFGLMHNILYLAAGLQVGLRYHLLMFAFTGVAALLLGTLNEKIYNGSLWPSILLHGAGNFFGTMLAAM